MAAALEKFVVPKELAAHATLGSRDMAITKKVYGSE
jgi:hypothetical protein